MVGMSKRVCVMWFNVDARAITGVIDRRCSGILLALNYRFTCVYDFGLEKYRELIDLL